MQRRAFLIIGPLVGAVFAACGSSPHARHRERPELAVHARTIVAEVGHEAIMLR